MQLQYHSDGNRTDIGLRHFDRGLWTLLLLVSVIWFQGYLLRPLDPARDRTQARLEITLTTTPSVKAKTAQENAEASADPRSVSPRKKPTVSSPSAPAPVPVPAPIPAPAPKAASSEPETDAITEAEPSELALEIKAALRQSSDLQVDTASDQSKQRIFSPTFRAQVKNAAKFNPKKEQESGIPFASDIEYVNSHGDISYRAANGCTFERHSFGTFGEHGTWWYFKGCDRPDEITLKYKRTTKKFAAFNEQR